MQVTALTHSPSQISSLCCATPRRARQVHSRHRTLKLTLPALQHNHSSGGLNLHTSRALKCLSVVVVQPHVYLIHNALWALHAEVVRQLVACTAANGHQAAAAATNSPGAENTQVLQSAAERDQTSEAAAAATVANLPECQPQDILRATAADGKELFLEVLDSSSTSSSSSSLQHEQQPNSPQSLSVAYQGVIYSLTPSPLPNSSSSSDNTAATATPSQPQAPYQLQPQGWVLQPGSDLVKALPGWSAAVQQQQAKQALPQQPLLLQSVSRVYSAAALQAAVQQNPAPWRDGTGRV